MIHVVSKTRHPYGGEPAPVIAEKRTLAERTF
jgi:hypothetical protein